MSAADLSDLNQVIDSRSLDRHLCTDLTFWVQLVMWHELIGENTIASKQISSRGDVKSMFQKQSFFSFCFCFCSGHTRNMQKHSKKLDLLWSNVDRVTPALLSMRYISFSRSAAADFSTHGLSYRAAQPESKRELRKCATCFSRMGLAGYGGMQKSGLVEIAGNPCRANFFIIMLKLGRVTGDPT
jgi:hypothetical protein